MFFSLRFRCRWDRNNPVKTQYNYTIIVVSHVLRSYRAICAYLREDSWANRVAIVMAFPVNKRHLSIIDLPWRLADLINYKQQQNQHPYKNKLCNRTHESGRVGVETFPREEREGCSGSDEREAMADTTDTEGCMTVTTNANTCLIKWGWLVGG